MITILLTIDVDADFFDSSISANALSFDKSWKGMELGVPSLIELFNDYTGSDRSPCVATWFIRADDQIKHHFGSYSYLLDNYRDLWEGLYRINHEIAWHPHLYNSSDWTQETNPELLRLQMKQSYSAVSKSLGRRLTASRIGEAFFTNEIAAILQDLGVKVDSTALPGRARNDGERSFDWTRTPDMPYFVSENDYSVTGAPALNLLEFPFSMVPVMAEYDTVPLKRYLDLSFWHHTICIGLEKMITENAVLNTIIHPSTTLPELSNGKRHGLLSFNIDQVRKNLDFIIDIAQRKSIPYRFKTIYEASTIYLNG